MTKSEALAKILETYSEEELLDAKDEPDTALDGTRSASVPRVPGNDGRGSDTTRR